MRRVLTTLMILLVVLVAGLSALVLLVNPQRFPRLHGAAGRGAQWLSTEA